MLRPSFGVVTLVLSGIVGGAADARPQSSGQVRLSLLEADSRSALRSCTLEVVARETSGDATLSCERNTQPVSRLAARRDLSASESRRLYSLASAPSPARAPSPGSLAPATGDGVQATLTIERDNARMVLDASARPEALSNTDREILRVLREIADELKAAGRR